MKIVIFSLTQIKDLTLWISNENCDLFSLAFRYLNLWISNENAQSNILPIEFLMVIAFYFLSQIKYLTLWLSNEKCDLFSLEINYLTLWISNGNCYLFSIAYQIFFQFLMKITILSLSQIKYLTLFHKWMEIWWCMICRSIENFDRLIVEHSLRVAGHCPVD